MTNSCVPDQQCAKLVSDLKPVKRRSLEWLDYHKEPKGDVADQQVEQNLQHWKVPTIQNHKRQQEPARNKQRNEVGSGSLLSFDGNSE